MKPYEPPPDLLLILLNPASTFDARKAALLALAADAWGRGWDECVETVAEALVLAGHDPLSVKATLQSARLQ